MGSAAQAALPCASRLVRRFLVYCIVRRYTDDQELSTRGIRRFFETGSKAGIQPKHASGFGCNDSAGCATYLLTWTCRVALPPVEGSACRAFCRVGDENWRLTFKFEGATPSWWITRTITDEGDMAQMHNPHIRAKC